MTKVNKYHAMLKILIVIWVTVLIACGIKGPPLPPIAEETIQKQKAGEASGETISGDTTKAQLPFEKSKK